jgi:MoxR-like ATPase
MIFRVGFRSTIKLLDNKDADYNLRKRINRESNRSKEAPFCGLVLLLFQGRSMKPSMLCEALLALIGQRVPLHVWGPCGVGKSQIVSQVADDLDREFLDVRAVQLDPIDLRGLPRITSDSTEWRSRGDD